MTIIGLSLISIESPYVTYFSSIVSQEEKSPSRDTKKDGSSIFASSLKEEAFESRRVEATWAVWENYLSWSTSLENIEAKKYWEREQEEMLGSLHASSSISCKPNVLSKIFQSSNGNSAESMRWYIFGDIPKHIIP